MIGVSKLYCGTVEPSDALRYERKAQQLPSHLLQFSEDKKPIVVWNCTRRAVTCAVSIAIPNPNASSMKGNSAPRRACASSIAWPNSARPSSFSAAASPPCGRIYSNSSPTPARQACAPSSAPTAPSLTRPSLKKLKALDLSYVGVSLDGMPEIHDRFRGVEGAYDRAIRGIRNSRAAGLKVGLRFTINRRNVDEIASIFDLLEAEEIPRVCFYHLVYAGRGSALIDEALSLERTREAVDLIINRTADLHRRGLAKEVLTVDNHCDGPYIYLRLLKEDPARAEEVLQLLQWNEGNSSGRGIACVSWDGAVHPDQFWRHLTLGNVRERDFGAIWDRF